MAGGTDPRQAHGRREPADRPARGRRGRVAAPLEPWLIAISVMLATFMEVLDTSVANVALPHIAGSLSASPERGHLGAHQLPGLQRHRAADHRLAERRVRPQALPA